MLVSISGGRSQRPLCPNHLLPCLCSFYRLLCLLDPGLQVGDFSLFGCLGLGGCDGLDRSLIKINFDGITDISAATLTKHWWTDHIGRAKHELQQHTGTDWTVSGDASSVALALDSNGCDVLVHTSIYAKQKNIADSLVRDK